MRRHADAFGDVQIYKTALDVGGEYAYRTRGEDHAWTAESVSNLQHAVRGNSQERYRAFAKTLNEQSERLLTLRGLFRFKTAEDDSASPCPRRGRAGEGNRQALCDRRDELRLDLA